MFIFRETERVGEQGTKERKDWEGGGEKGEGERERGDWAKNKWNQKCYIPEAFISLNEMETVKGKHCFAFLKIVFPVE